MSRPIVPDKEVKRALLRLRKRLKDRIAKHSGGAYYSRHETLGLLTEEVKELLDAVHTNNHVNFEEELIDIAVVVIFGHASHRVIYDRKTGKRK